MRLRRLLGAILGTWVLAYAAPAWAFATVGSPATCGGTNGCTTTGFDTTGADVLVVSIGHYTANASVSDNKSNTWHCANENQAGGIGAGLCYTTKGGDAATFAVGASHTVTTSCSGCFPGTIFWAVSGSLTSGDPKDGATSVNLCSVACTTIQPGSITPSGTDLFVVNLANGGCGSFNGGSDPTIGSSFTKVASLAWANGSNCFAIIDQKTSGSAENPQWSFTSDTVETIMVAFKPSGGAAATSPNNCGVRLLLGVGCEETR